MGKLKIKASTVDYGSLSERSARDKKNRRLIVVALILAVLNLGWNVLNDQDEIEYNYNKILEKVEDMRD